MFADDEMQFAVFSFVSGHGWKMKRERRSLVWEMRKNL
jgi:hypothetical protein